MPIPSVVPRVVSRALDSALFSVLLPDFSTSLGAGSSSSHAPTPCSSSIAPAIASAPIVCRLRSLLRFLSSSTLAILLLHMPAR